MRSPLRFLRTAIGSAVLSLWAASTIWAAPPEVTARIDEQLRAAWKQHHITPAAEVDDARFLRRASLDLVGQLPAPETVARFLADTDPDKRSRAIDALLASPDYAEHWAAYWDNLLMGRLTREAYLDRGAFHIWLREQFEKNVPWDRLVRDLITAEGYNTNRPALRGGSQMPGDFQERFNPATNFFLRYSRSLPDFASATSKLFLGVQIQCAQCHDHKTEKWTQQDFQQFTACFAKTWGTYVDKPGMLTQMVGIFRMELKDRLFAPPVKQYETFFGSYADYVDMRPKLLNGPELRSWGSRRAAAAQWLTAQDNPWFAQAIVNRLWGKLLGRGFVSPVDDIRPGNPPTLPEALETLADDFRAHGHDLKHLLRAICHSAAYQRACDEGLRAEQHSYWASYPIKPLDVEELFDAIVVGTGAKAALEQSSKGNFALIRGAFIQQLVTQMGTDDMAEVTELEETIPRALLLLNGALVGGATRVSAGYGLGRLLAEKDDAVVVEQLYLRTLCRRPTAAEKQQWLAFVGRPRSVVRTPGPPAALPTGLAALRVSEAIAQAGPDADFTQLLKHAKTAADFAALRDRMKNNADLGLYAKAFQAFAAEAPFAYLATLGGGTTPREQAFEDLCWALVNCTEFLTNH